MVSQLNTKLKDFFVINDTPDVDPLTQWEAHKCTIRGQILIFIRGSEKVPSVSGEFPVLLHLYARKGT